MKNKLIIINLLFFYNSIFSQSIEVTTERSICDDFIFKSIDSILVKNKNFHIGDKRPFILFNVSIESKDSTYGIEIFKLINIECEFIEIESLLKQINFSCLYKEALKYEDNPIGFRIPYKNGLIGD